MKIPVSILILTPVALALGALAISLPANPSAPTQSLRKWTERSMNSVHAIEVSVALDERAPRIAWVRFAPMSTEAMLAMQAAAAPNPLQMNPLPITAAEVELDLLQDAQPAQIHHATTAVGQAQAIVAVPEPAGGGGGQPMKIARRAYSNGLLVYEDEAILRFR